MRYQQFLRDRLIYRHVVFDGLSTTDLIKTERTPKFLGRTAGLEMKCKPASNEADVLIYVLILENMVI